MDPISLFKCLGDPTRLRILHLLTKGPLCVCEIQDALSEPQVKISKHIGYMKKRGLLSSHREANWNIYEITPQESPILYANLRALEEYANEQPVLTADLQRLNEAKRNSRC